MSRRLVALIFALLALVMAAPAHAITNGNPDGNQHPYVGAYVVPAGAGAPYPYYANCSGTLIALTLFLTAAHCGDHDGDKALVTFDSDLTNGVDHLYSGTFHPDPAYSHRQNDPHDIAVVSIDPKDPVTGITPAELPTLNEFAMLTKNQTFTAVGYGATGREKGPGQEFNYPDSRKYAVSTLNAVNKAWLRLSQNPSTGDGGTCYGDSGGPNFYGTTNTIAALTNTGDTVCRATNVVYRVDTLSAQEFLYSVGAVADPSTQVAPAPKPKADKGKSRHHGHGKTRHGNRH